MPSQAHTFVAFVENLSLKEIAAAFPEARGSAPSSTSSTNPTPSGTTRRWTASTRMSELLLSLLRLE